MKIVLTNLVYGETYAKLFLENHLKSLLDPTNLPKVKGSVEKYFIFCDNETKPMLQKHTNMMRLLAEVEVEFRDFTWRPDMNGALKFDARYSALVGQFVQSVTIALERGAVLGAWTADMVLAKHFLPRALEKLDDGWDGVFIQPPRACAEGIAEVFQHVEGALDANELWAALHQKHHMHPYLYAANHWGSPTFTNEPYYLLWNTGTGILCRTFSVTPIVLRPTPEMTEARQVIDISIAPLIEKPYWVEDFDEMGLILCEPVLCYNKVLTNMPPQIDRLQKFAEQRHPHQREYLKERKFYYPNRFVANVSPEVMAESDHAVDMILGDEEFDPAFEEATKTEEWGVDQ